MLELAHRVGDALAAAEQALAAAGLPEPRREAHALWGQVACEPASAAWLAREAPLPPVRGERFRAAVAHRAAGWPAAYAAGWAQFRDHWLAVDRRVLIPRAETEGLVQLVIDWAATRAALPLVADLGTGSGAIAIALALEARVAGVIATDVADGALALALENAARCGAAERISVRRGPWCLPLLDDRVDAIVSNPPYIATAECDALEPAVREFEPRVALDGGPDGLEPTRRLATEARGSLAAGGLLALEVDARRAEASAALLTDAGFDRVVVHQDLFGRPRYVLGRQPEHA